MAKGPRTWICRRVSNKVRCGHVNPKVKHICSACGKRRPATKQPAHRAILKEMPYEEWVKLYGERCGICGFVPGEGDRRLHRDHSHVSGAPRGLLCWPCNRILTTRITAEIAEKIAIYLRRAAALN